LPPGVVTQVGGHAITRQALAHWTVVEAITQSVTALTQPVPRGVVPTPPGYQDCIAYLAAIDKANQPRSVPDNAHLKEQCAQEYEKVQIRALQALIIHYWVKEEAARAHVAAVTSEELGQTLHRDFSTEAGFHRFLALTGLHASDERRIVEDELLRAKWVSTLPGVVRLRRSKAPESGQMVGEIDREQYEQTENMRLRWIPRTHCRVGYVVPLCSEYQR